MNNTASVDVMSLVFTSSLVLVALFFSYWQKLRLEKDIIISAVRAVIQLVAVGYVLEYIFGCESPVFTTLLLLVMFFNAAYNAAKRGAAVKNGLPISFIAITAGASATIFVLVMSKIIKYEPYQVVPISGMIVSNAMIALGLCYRQLAQDFKNKRAEVETKLSLGADILPSSIEIIRDAIKTGMLPTLDAAKALGIVSLPGMMTGLILAGAHPMEAIKYQLMVSFMLMSTTSIASFIACYMAYRDFFNARKQVIFIK
ncbi:MAG: iron export ABC transporter permease subunit FetB [Schwartzia sp.]|nr:iron export ABC transporter permease subunit FetB [Schwartzia sp. (in: firmicutes)]